MSDFQSILNGIFRIFIFSTIDVHFSVKLFFSVARLSTVCIYTLLLCCVRVWKWDGNGNNPMRIP